MATRRKPTTKKPATRKPDAKRSSGKGVGKSRPVAKPQSEAKPRAAAPRRPVVLVTGASSGIGEALARQFAAAGHDLVLVARRRDKLKTLAAALKARHGTASLVEVADLARPGTPQRLAARLASRGLDVDILVNNAGINALGEFARMPVRENQDIVALNVVAATDMLSSFLPAMVERGHGRVLNVVSTSAFVPVPNMATYAASKSYLLSLTESLAEELGGTGVTITALCPGVTETPMVEQMREMNAALVKVIAFTVSDVDEVAREGYEACMAGEVIRVPGYVNLLTAISSRAAPRWLVRRISGLLGRSAH